MDKYKGLMQQKAKVDQTIEEHTLELLEKYKELLALGYIREEDIERIRKAIKFHDSGKANRHFQRRISEKTKFLGDEGEVGHNLLSAMLYFMEHDDPYVFYAILNHHAYVDNLKALSEESEKVRENLREMYESLDVPQELDDWEFDDKLYDADDLVGDIQKEIKRDEFKALRILGTLMRCDYAASSHSTIEYEANFLNEKMDALLERWTSNSEDASWNELQIYCKNHQDENLIIVAPTGMGKTEAALHWIGNHKGFFILPIKAALNAIFHRIRSEILQSNAIHTRVALLHGETFRKYQEIAEELSNDVSMLYTYYDETRKMAMPLTVSTPDQLFNFVLKGKGAEVKMSVLSYSKVVIDEIQAYDAQLLAAMVYGIQKIIDLGGNVAIFTATLPPFIRTLLQSTKSNLVPFDKYAFTFQKFPSDLERHNIQVSPSELNASDIYQHYKNNTWDHKKYFVVANTVKQAQKIYHDLAEKGMTNIHMLHSKFRKKDRDAKETEIMQVGKTFDENHQLTKGNSIWVCTQVVEASLDIDFDYLFTELSDLNGLFQRLGRVNRKGAKRVDLPNCFVYTEVSPRILKKSQSNYGFIDYGIYRLSKKAIESIGNGIITESTKQRLIEDYLTIEKLIEDDSPFLSDYWDHYNFIRDLNFGELKERDQKMDFRNITSYNILPCDENNELYFKDEVTSIIDEIEMLKEQVKNSLLEEKQKWQLELRKKINELMDYTLSVRPDEIKDRKAGEDIEISKYNKLKRVRCYYDQKIGFVALQQEKLANPSNEDTDSVFI